MSYNSIAVIFSPYHVGIYDHRVGGGPNRIREHGIVETLTKLGIHIKTVEIQPVDEFEGEIGRSFEVMRRISKAVSKALEERSFPLVLSGNCYASVGVVAGLGVKDLGIVWIDAHDDLDTPSTNVNGYFDAMGVSMLAGKSWHTLVQSISGHAPHSLDKFVFCGLRDCSDEQRQAVREAGVDVVWGNTTQHVDFAGELKAVLETKPFGPIHVHLDLDVLDESLGRVNDWPSPGGLHESDLQGCMKMLPQKATLTSLTVASFNPFTNDGDAIAQIAVRGIETFFRSLQQSGAFESTSEHI